MKINYSLPSILSILIALVLLTLLLEFLDEKYHETQGQQKIQTQLKQLGHNLQQQLDHFSEESRTLAQRFVQNPDAIDNPQKAGYLEGLSSKAPLINWSFAKGSVIRFAWPTKGNEAVIGVDYRYRPEFMAAVRRAMENRTTVITSTITLLQTGRPGIIIRSPIFSEDGNYLGIISATLDLDGLLQAAGYSQEHGYRPLIQTQPAHRARHMVIGDHLNFAKLPEGPQLRLAEDSLWEIRAQPLPTSKPALLEHSELIRLAGAILSTLVIFFMLKGAGFLPIFTFSRKGISLQMAMHAVTLIPLLLLILLVELFYFDTLRRSSEQQLESLANSLMREAQLQARAFFDVPKQAISVVELFRQGLLTTKEPDEMLSFFAAQMRVQPQLTFLSIGNEEGEYFAASRPPTGADRSLRLQWATLNTGREMRVHWAADDNQPTELFLHGAKHFDARDKVWYQNALKAGKIEWYPVYRYTTSDERKQYDALGIGIAAPIHANDTSLIGVMTADVALSQINDFLKYQTQSSAATLYMTELDGKLLALSTDDPAYLMDENNTARRLLTSESDNPLIRLTGASVLAADNPRGQQFFDFNDQKYLLNWGRIEIPDGPTFNMILAITSKQAASATRQLWSNGLYLGWLLLMFSIILVFFATRRITRPLLALERWASRLGLGKLKSPVPPPGPILEIASLNKTMDGMAGQLNEYTEKLEDLVHERTEALKVANAELERLSQIDGLTGLANRRHLDESGERLLQQAHRNHQNLALLLMDVDYFKAYNDHYGHQAGDEVLKSVAQILKTQARRASDLAGRYGGEEFALVLSDTSMDDALKIGEQILATLAEAQVPHQQSPIGRLSLSIGIALAPVDRDYRLDLLYKNADLALYQAKSQGRNRVLPFQG